MTIDDAPPAKLYVAYLGGDPTPGRMGEDHEIVFVVAADLKAARTAAKKKWQGRGRGHIDAVAELNEVDGFRIRLDPAGDGERAGVVLDPTYVR